MTPEIVIEDTEALQNRLASEVEKLVSIALARRKAFVIALPGGSVATTFFPALSAMAVDWSQTDFFWTDERAVPPEDPDSNYAVALKLWLGPARVPSSRIHRMRGEEPDLEAAARLAAAALSGVAGNPPHLDVALVGVGEDGHVASIFPGRALPHVLVAPVYGAPKPPPRRLTLTLPVLAGAERTIVAALGASKSTAMRDALQQDDCATPAAELLRRSRSALVLLDRSAGSVLETGRTP